MKMGIQNPFDLYAGPEDEKRARECTSKLKKAWKNFRREVYRIQDEYKDVGASDTVSREELCDWVKNKHGDLF